MCVNQRYIVNPYTRRSLYVKCGKCPACLQEKAIHRVRRIKNTQSDDLECCLVSLTYSRSCAPYIDRSEAYNFSRGRLPYLNVYRDSEHRRVRIGSGYDFEYRSRPGRVVLDTIPYECQVDFDNTKDLKYENGKIGVCYYPDLQKFMARLRLNLKRIYNYDKTFKAFCCSEYGSKSHRPHMHLLFFYSKGDFEILRSAVVKSWPFSDLSSFPRSVEKCYRGASYVASYVNLGSRFPAFLKAYFKPKHSYSKGFGLGNRHFSLRSILQAFNRGSLSYGVIRSSGTSTTVARLPIPKYVIHRYFPKFKGYSRIAPTALLDNMRRFGNGEIEQLNKSVAPLYYSDDEVHKIAVRLHNAMSRCWSECPDLLSQSFDEYYQLHVNIWNLYNSNLLRFQMEDDSLFLYEKYDNLDTVLAGIDDRFLSEKFRSDKRFYPPGFTRFMLSDNRDPNKFPHNVAKTRLLRMDYYDNIKHRTVTNSVLSSTFDEW